MISSDRTNIGLFGGHIGISISNKILSFAIRDKLRFAGTRDEYGEFRRSVVKYIDSMRVPITAGAKEKRVAQYP